MSTGFTLIAKTKDSYIFRDRVVLIVISTHVGSEDHASPHVYTPWGVHDGFGWVEVLAPGSLCLILAI